MSTHIRDMRRSLLTGGTLSEALHHHIWLLALLEWFGLVGSYPLAGEAPADDEKERT